MALIPNIEHLVIPFLLIYGLNYFFSEFGPNATTFVYPCRNLSGGDSHQGPWYCFRHGQN